MVLGNCTDSIISRETKLIKVSRFSYIFSHKIQSFYFFITPKTTILVYHLHKKIFIFESNIDYFSVN